MKFTEQFNNYLSSVSLQPWPLLLVLLAAIACLKLIFMWFLMPVAADFGLVPSSVSTFGDHYHSIAQNIVDGHGFRIMPDTAETLVRSPGYVYFLAGLFLFFGKNLIAVQVANVSLGFATACVIFALTKNITKNNRMAIVASIVFSLFPAVILLESRASVESLFMFSFSVFVLLLYNAFESDTLKNYFIAGLALGLTLLIRTAPIPFILFLFVYLLFVHKNSNPLKAATIRMSVLMFAAVLVLSPWIVRNYSLTGNPSISESLLGIGAFQGYYITKTMNDGRPYKDRIQEAAREQSKIAAQNGVVFKEAGYWDVFYSVEDELKYNKVLFDYVVNQYKKDPFLFIKHCFYNSIRFWFQGTSPKITLIGVFLILPILVLTIIGTYIGMRQRLQIAPLLLVIVAIYMIHIPLISHAKYHIPLMPFLIVLASIGLSHKNLLGRWLDRKDNQ